MVWLDNNRSVTAWGSEEVVIPYKHPITGRMHRYFPDFFVEILNKNNKIERWIVEIKPWKQVQEPKVRKSRSKRYINEVKTYAVNRYKWDYAEAWCADRGYKFIIITEKELGI